MISENYEMFQALIDPVLTVPGTKTTTKYKKIVEAYQVFLDGYRKDTAKELETAVTQGQADKVPALLRTAMIEQTSPGERLGEDIEYVLVPALREEYRKVYEANHQTIADAFNLQAAKLVKARDLAMLDPAPEALAQTDDKGRAAYLDALGAKGQLTRLMHIMIVNLKAVQHSVNDGQRDPDDQTITLSINTDRLDRKDRRPIWEAYDKHGLSDDLWAALLKTGITLEARPIGKVQPYRRAQGFMTRYTNVGQGVSRIEHYDPELETKDGKQL